MVAMKRFPTIATMTAIGFGTVMLAPPHQAAAATLPDAFAITIVTNSNTTTENRDTGTTSASSTLTSGVVKAYPLDNQQ